MLGLLFYLISEMYKKGSNEYSGELDITCCTALLIYLLENFQKNLPEPVYNNLFEFFRVNMAKYNSRMLKTLNSQLLGLLFWLSPISTLTLAHKFNILPSVLK